MLLHEAFTHAADACCNFAPERSTEGEVGGNSVPGAAPAIPACFRPAVANNISRAPAPKRKAGHTKVAAMAKAKANAATRELPQLDLRAERCLAACQAMTVRAACVCLLQSATAHTILAFTASAAVII